MNNKQDFTGLKFNKLTVVGDAPSRRQPSGKMDRRVIVRCDCGIEKDLSWKSVKQNRIKSCGCLAEELKTIVTKGDRYNNWTIIEEVEPKIDKYGKSRKVKAECICGTVRELILTSIKNGYTKSCGCIKVDTTGKRVDIESPIPEITLEQLNKRAKGLWSVIEIISAERNEKAEIVRMIKMKCKCGFEKITNSDNIKDYKSCYNCYCKNKEPKYSEEEQKLRNRINNVYLGLKSRCNYIKDKDYKNYGARGIKVDESFSKFEKFFNWIIKQGYTIDCKLQVDRIDNNGNYSVDNCRLVTRTENNRNMRSTKLNWDLVNAIREGEYKDMTSKEIAKIIGCCRTTIESVMKFKTWIK